MENENEPEQGDQTPLKLVFLEVLLACTPDELGRINATIRAAGQLPSGADRVIAAGIADPEIAAKLEALEQKRRKAHQVLINGTRGLTQAEIRENARRKREEQEARRAERQREREQREAAQREQKEARKLAQQQRRREKRAEALERKRQREAAANQQTPPQITPPPVAMPNAEPQQTAPAKRKRKKWREQMRKIRKFKRRR